MLKLGVVAIQGAVSEHIHSLKLALAKLNLIGDVKSVKKPIDLEDVQGIVIPGGESTVIGRIAERMSLLKVLREKIEGGFPVLGTCAGTILLAKEVYDAKVGKVNQPLIGVMNIKVIRNYYGRQKESFEVDLEIPLLGNKPFRGVFIRAPAIESVGDNVKVLALHEGLPVLVQQDKILAATFHPELTEDTRIHELFIKNILN
ncbi:MAG: pyridoxal 5'-phosphate synthase glutaminase subunit PdxT [Candidatus Nezhaarchaeota archaeon]|nr:pyridoxal 5'-phosphate synthase glutaminase subunit PdxT [Candidatus Nezhaarchaeota archaeon]MCX8142112.1 pyridoxal 5'-phosphate synthase glutaminase subunit PdxT [Candidatus Nezhaarchaeota archaeon]MDW8050107.1 pyridoxal 5'-phosphate synthase glutaminase subunit PdxT [Nitrososphaerota archaeon]